MKKEQTQSLKAFHAAVAALAILALLAAIFIENWGDLLHWLPIAGVLLTSGKYEKLDELARENLYKANTITMWCLFGLLIWFAMFARFHAIPVKHIVVAGCAVAALRSILFLILDRTPSAEESGE